MLFPFFLQLESPSLTSTSFFNLFLSPSFLFPSSLFSLFLLPLQASVSAISLALLATLCLSLACLSAGKGSSLWARHARRGYDFKAGWLAFSSNRNGGGSSSSRGLREISYGTAIAGAVAASTLVLSCVLSAVCLTLCLLGKAGGFLAAVAVPASVLVAAPLCVFQVLLSIYGSKAIQREIGLRWVPWPDIGWCLGIGKEEFWGKRKRERVFLFVFHFDDLFSFFLFSFLLSLSHTQRYLNNNKKSQLRPSSGRW
mgnify:FL=1